MAYPDVGRSSANHVDWRQPGTKRKKLAGYIRAANEIRQSYFGTEGGFGTGNDEGAGNIFPDATAICSGDEEMILFPSYARKHIKDQTQQTRSNESEQEYWEREWNRHQSDNGVADVDVRGWMFAPHRGPITRRQRLVLGLARQMSGLPASVSQVRADGSVRSDSSRANSPTRPRRDEEDMIAQEAAKLVHRGEREGQRTDRGEFSEIPSKLGGTSSRASANSSQEDVSTGGLQKSMSWQSPANMTPAELTAANERLAQRLKPFMANPLANTPVSAFFYNESCSRQHTVYTDPSGHFSLRAVLDFVPTHVRVFAGEKLSATEAIKVTSHQGVSLISDVDDTVKHSAIAAGAREIFRNVFIRDLGDLTIEGVREWYNTLYDMGVQIHYVSNSPWQLYPLLTSFFKMAKLPPGSFHLKQYSGLFQGIFEPVAERKKSSLDKIMRDFPERKFILVGDSGEADLEVYTETALENPGRVLGIFIRDVTTPIRTGYFDSTAPPAPPAGIRGYHTASQPERRGRDFPGRHQHMSHPNTTQEDDPHLQAAIAASLADLDNHGRQPQSTSDMDAQEEDLIDFSEPEPAPPVSSGIHAQIAQKRSPPPPPKPAALRRFPSSTSGTSETKSEKAAPPRPRKPSSTVRPGTNLAQSPPLPSQQTPTSRNPVQSSRSMHESASRPIKEPPSLPLRPRRPVPPANKPSLASNAATRAAMLSATPRSLDDLKKPPPLLPPRRNLSGLSLGGARLAAANQMGGGGSAGAWSDDSRASSPGDGGHGRKEYMWRQRLARAQSILEPRGVMIRTWRTGADVANVCVQLAERGIRGANE